MLVAALAPLALPPDAVNEWFKERRKLEAHHAEPKGALQQPQYMGYLGDVRTLQAAAEAKEAAAIEGLPRLQAHLIGTSPLCAPQNLGAGACAACTKDPMVRQRAKRHQRAHLLFLNTPKSGGSALECATQGNPLGPRWTNMGHTTQKAVAACMTACTFGGRPPKVVVMVRDPYDYWRSRYLFAHECQLAARCTQEFGIDSFLGYLRYIEAKGDFPNGAGTSPWMPQSYLLRQQCGQPCRHDHLFHTSSMQADWLALMNEIGAPRTLLPLPANLTRMSPCRGQGGENNKCTPPTVFSLEVLRIIHRIDANMFDEWGYTKRDRQFELADAWGSESVADSVNPVTADSVNPIAALRAVVSGEVDSMNAATAEAQAEAQAEVQAVADAEALEVAVAKDQARVDAKKAAAEAVRVAAGHGSRIEGRQVRQDQAVADAKAEAAGKAAAGAGAGPEAVAAAVADAKAEAKGKAAAEAAEAEAVAAEAAEAVAEAGAAKVTLREAHVTGQAVEAQSETQVASKPWPLTPTSNPNPNPNPNPNAGGARRDQGRGERRG